VERRRLRGHIRRPSADEIRRLAEMEYLRLTEQEAATFQELMDELLPLVDALDDLPQPLPTLKYTNRDPGYRPGPAEDPYNLYIRKCRVEGSAAGKLAGKRVGLKDNISVAGVPLTNGSRVLEGYVPTVDATVVERLLEAGAVIVGKLNQDDYSLGGTGESSAFGCVRNPRNPAHSAGGSSSGSGAALAAGEVDLALGVDQRGSGRIPAAWCGVVAIKPTHGLVPTFGLVYFDHTLDHICPMACTVADTALTLEVIAGEDPRDPQWVRGPIRVDQYTQAPARPPSELRIGVLREAFDWPVSEPDVSELVRGTIRRLEERGVSCQEVSVPLLKHAQAIFFGLTVHSVSAMVESDQEGYWRGGLCNVDWQTAFGKFRRSRADDFSPRLKLFMILGKYLRREYLSTYYSKAQNLRLTLRQQVDDVLRTVDVLAMPTTPQKPFQLVESIDARALHTRGPNMTDNTVPFDLTGHPALTVPCGTSAGLPVGLQLVGRHWQERLLFGLGRLVEEARG
jgi:amidase